MSKRAAALVLSGALIAGAGAVAITPASAASADNPITSRLGKIKDALSGLVSDGTLTQDQADKVAATLDDALPQRDWHRGEPGGPMRGLAMMRGLDVAAKTLGMTDAELRTALMDGKSLADVAQDQGVPVDTLVSALVDSVTKNIDQAVADGRLTQEQADMFTKDLTARMTDRVNGVRPQWGDHGGDHGMPGPSDLPPSSGEPGSSSENSPTTNTAYSPSI